MYELSIHTDGGARGNPGPAATGIFIQCGEWQKLVGQYIGETTNNVAEYTAVLEALKLLPTCLAELDQSVTQAHFFLDSELVVKQLNGQYRVKDPGMQHLYGQVMGHIKELPFPVRFQHVPRCENKVADRLVNQALDAQLQQVVRVET